ncbi:isocitrate lyase/PEP mutase family protein [Pacificoceanicola onchidii]|uniref:isocitrate lyase/PEP mutase family protein n=1 Tax=Pacificoceanicola onchidii TaxID=2562685 RepID=UPI0010A6628F|nr:isocitrate lyase/phosphoenolpyruvate mutase family protein [Pacificoceanicola onchidii]
MTDIGNQFRALHRPGAPFILANAWDIGSAKMLAAMGAEAIATSSAAHAFTLGRPDMGTVTRDEALAHAQDLVSAVNVPVSGDFENGFGEAPETCAETIRLSAEVGLAGISIEDTALPDDAPYERELAVERIRAAAAAARALPKDFVLCARADGVMNGQYDLTEAITRIQAYEQAGADCVYIPLPPSFDDIDKICQSVSTPVNVLVAGKFTAHTRAQYAAAGAARLSLGSALARATHRVIHDAAAKMYNDGDFSGLMPSISGDVIDKLLE